MSGAAALVVVLDAAFGLLAPRLARRLPPRTATWLLTLGSAVAAATGVAVVVMLALPLVAQDPEVAEQGRWSVQVFRQAGPAGPVAEAIALVALVALIVHVAFVAGRRVRAYVVAARLCRVLPRAGGDLVVLPDGAATALAVPGHPGRIVVSRGLLRQLDAADRAALLAHERSHLAHAHHAHLTLVALAAAANPVLRPLLPAAELAVERWADEDAAGAAGRDAALSSLAKAAACATGPRRAAVTLAATAGPVPLRVQHLLAAPPRRRVMPVAAMIALLTAATLLAGHVATSTAALFDSARDAIESTS